jgi:cytoskeletal protein RodZ
LATLLGALILLGLILYLVAAIRRRRSKAIAAKRASVPKVQPKHSSVSELDDLFRSAPVESSASSNMPSDSATKAARASAAATPQNQSWGLKKPSVVAPSAGHDHSNDKEDREVFEL